MISRSVRKRTQLRQAASDPLDSPAFGRSEVVGNKQMPMLEQITDLLPETLVPPGRPLGLLAARTASPQGLLLGGQFFADLGPRAKHRLGDFGEYVELAYLMPYARENRGNWLGIQRRTIGRDALQNESTRFQGGTESREELADVVVRRIVIQD